MICGSALTANSAQEGHCRSPNSIIVARAWGLPSVMPRWGMPSSSASVRGAPGTGLPGASSDVLPAPSTATSTAATTAVVTSRAPSW